MAYKVGHCPQCDGQIMVQDTNGQWNSFKPSFRQADLHFKDGHRIRTTICEKCLQNPDLEKLMDAITCEESEACDGNIKEEIKSRGLPISLQLAVKAKQGVRLGVRLGN